MEKSTIVDKKGADLPIFPPDFPPVPISSKLRMEIPSATFAEASFAKIHLGTLQPGTTVVQTLRIVNLNTNIKTGQTTLKNIKVGVTLEFYLEWQLRLYFRVHAPWCRHYTVVNINKNGTTPLGTLKFDVAIPDINVALGELNFSTPLTTIDNLQLAVTPITNIDLPGVKATKMLISDIKL